MNDWCPTHGVHSLAEECPACKAGKFPGFPPGAVGYCAIGHAEIWTKEVACPLCAALHRGDKLQKLYDFVVAAHRKELSE